MSDYENNITGTHSFSEARLRDLAAEHDRVREQLQAERDTAREALARVRAELSGLRSDLQQALAVWAENNLDETDSSYAELSELMTDNGLEGLKRKFTVTVRVSYEFDVEVMAASEDEAQDEVDNDIYTHIDENLDAHSYDDIDFDVTEA